MPKTVESVVEVTVEAVFKSAHKGYWYEVWKTEHEAGSKLAGYDGTWRDSRDAIDAGKKWAKSKNFKVVGTSISHRG